MESRWSAVYMSGDEMFFEHNWVGLEEGGDSPVKILAALDHGIGVDSIARAQGGIQIAGPSKNVFVVENEIVGGRRNGITLGNFVILDGDGRDNGKIVGVLLELEDECSTAGSSQAPSTTSGSNPRKIGAGGVIENLFIDRNRIHDMGMCGIGPVGFFDLTLSAQVSTGYLLMFRPQSVDMSSEIG
jgi:hypothetical protein